MRNFQQKKIYKYAHPEFFADWETPDLNSGNVILWGAGRVGGIAAHCLTKRGIEFAAFCDIAQDKQGTEYCGHQVISPEELKQNYPDAIVLISAVFFPKIVETLTQMGFEKIYNCAALFMEIDFDGYDFWMEPEYAIRNIEQYLGTCRFYLEENAYVDRLYLYVTSNCTLRCRDCSAMIPYVSSPENYPADEILKDFNSVLNEIGYTRNVNFYGGEPFLHPDLGKMIDRLREDNRFDRLTIITNGTLLPSHELLNAIKSEPRLHIRISHYGYLSKKADELVALFTRSGISHEVTNYEYWDSPTKIGNFNVSANELSIRFMQCVSSELTILNGKAYFCAPAATLCNMRVFPESPTNYVDLRDNQNLNSELRDYIERAYSGAYIDACKYCSGMHCSHFEDKVPVAVQTKELLKIKALCEEKK